VGIGLSSWTITLVGVPPSDIRVLPEQQARDKSKAKRKNYGDKENADIIKN
jgi:hypothetical protein